MNNSNKVVVSMKKYVWILYFLKRDPRVNRKAKLVVLMTLAYALSPIDLIPDFIPILGLLDDLIIIPLGIYLAIKLIPQEVWNDCNRLADISIDKGELLPKNWVVASIIVLLWVIVITLVAKWLWHFFLT
ncbi:TPA: DUF1232 domain-containing protein [Legionella pneumophila]|uniref:Uncharacterized conserved protein n=3 Tax=Legionella TaxID=445 RepID=A0A378PG93_9GAMM|nr:MULTISPECIES: YkvA family protein [Legionella]RJT65022.1 DUF1232 domain-containing protein [Legionella taurinensis]KTD70638.1 hypothetical protein Lstg_3123 [Legionella steigerwaltii]MBN9228729.1 DUF1232 domain-containing protein [Legionella steelei]MCL9684039.1 DUF1232 domain-containing protein [Legionella maioricensis]MCL9687054.1 DUF1232 domain-containing protein [Legionella maioricensis]